MKYDIAIIGGGPAGMMAAGRAGELGANVVLLEKNPRLGIKLLATGGGRANITNLSSDRELAASFGSTGAWLLSGLSKFGPEELIEFFNSRGLKTKVEEGNRVFPKSNSASDVLQVLLDYLSSSNVDIKLGAEVKKIIKAGDQIQKVILTDGREVVANKFIICTGGKSYPLTGSTGDGYKWLKQLGHQIIPPRPALVPIILKDKFVKDLEGLSLKDVKISCYQHGKSIWATSGSAIFTASGISGPAILNLSAAISRLDPKGLELRLDLLPDLDAGQLDKKLQADFNSSNRIYQNALADLVPPKLVNTLVALSGVNGTKKLNLISRAERQNLVKLLKEFKLTVFGLAGYDRAMVTAGGVSLKEVDSRTMQSKVVPNLYLAGEVLDLNGPTGGYNLQLCWTSGYLAGEAVAQSV